jgi:multidrug transporter EmrE-like cation transporter
MFRTKLHAISPIANTHSNAWVASLLVSNVLFNVVSNGSFKVSAQSDNLRSFIFWQVIGNLAGFITVITLTGLLRFIPLHIAFPVTTGLAVIGVQLIAGKFLFGEAISTERWLGTILVVLGIALISKR